MTLFVENETKTKYNFDIEGLVRRLAEAVLDQEACPYEVQLNVLLTDDKGIRKYNRDYRGLDAETDVLSFPNLDFAVPADFSEAEKSEADYFDPDTGELVLGDVILSVDRIEKQAGEYGHGLKREFAFLVVHSLLHLCGYDHMEAEEAACMEARQEAVLESLGITRESE